MRRCVKVFVQMTSLGIYVQVPFCQTKCTYCNFHTGVVSSSRFAPYVTNVCREIQSYRDLYLAAGIELAPAISENATVDTVYIGGGAPGLLVSLRLRQYFGSSSGS